MSSRVTKIKLTTLPKATTLRKLEARRLEASSASSSARSADACTIQSPNLTSSSIASISNQRSTIKICSTKSPNRSAPDPQIRSLNTRYALDLQLGGYTDSRRSVHSFIAASLERERTSAEEKSRERERAEIVIGEMKNEMERAGF